MALSDIVSAGVTTAFKVIDDILTTIDYYSYESTVNDVVTGTPTSRYAQQEDLKVLFYQYETEEVDGQNIQSNDKRVLIDGSAMLYRPKPKDKLREKSGQEWRFIAYDPESDPTESAYILQCRRVK